MEIAIIGWYGTETIGDRAILAGLFRVFSEIVPSFHIRLGSLYPFYSERTIAEDMSFYESISSNSLKSITIFDTRNPFQLKKNIRKADLLIVGGGPLMDLNEMSMLEYAFVYAKNIHIKSMLVGCGWGPLKNSKSIRSAIRLIELADSVIFRDSDSKEQCRNYCPMFMEKVESAIDPAFFACDFFVNSVNRQRTGEHVAINFRDIALEGQHYSDKELPDGVFLKIVDSIASQTDIPIKLIPMHNFFIGGDDRVILTRIKNTLDYPNIFVVQQPLSLYETMEQFYHAKLCIGMRFHSIVLQTIVNGNNYIVDYTDPNSGKIIGMLRQLNIEDTYSKRYYSLHKDCDIFRIQVNSEERYSYSKPTIKEYFSHYCDVISTIVR